MFIIIAFRKSFKNVALFFSLEYYTQEHKFETWFDNLFMIFFLKVIWKSLYFKVLYLTINWLNLIYLWIFKVEAINFFRGYFS
jgi:cell division septal protein FtsQ